MKQKINDFIEREIDRVLSEAFQSKILQKLMRANYAKAREAHTTTEYGVSIPQWDAFRAQGIDWNLVKDSDFEVLAPEDAVKILADARQRNLPFTGSSAIQKEPLIFWYNIDRRRDPNWKGHKPQPEYVVIPANTLVLITQGRTWVGQGFDSPGWYTRAYTTLEMKVFEKAAHSMCDLAYVLRNPPRTTQQRAARRKAQKGAESLWNPKKVKAEYFEHKWALMRDKYTPDRIKELISKILRAASTNMVTMLQQSPGDIDFSEVTKMDKLIGNTWETYSNMLDSAEQYARMLSQWGGDEEEKEVFRQSYERESSSFLRSLRGYWLKVTGKRDYGVSPHTFIETMIDRMLTETFKSKHLAELAKIYPPISYKQSFKALLLRVDPFISWSQLTDDDVLKMSAEDAHNNYRDVIVFWVKTKPSSDIDTVPVGLISITDDDEAFSDFGGHYFGWAGTPRGLNAGADDPSLAAKLADTAYVVDPEKIAAKYRNTRLELKKKREKARSGAAALLGPGEFLVYNLTRYQSIMAGRATPESVKALMSRIIHLANLKYREICDEIMNDPAHIESKMFVSTNLDYAFDAFERIVNKMDQARKNPGLSNSFAHDLQTMKEVLYELQGRHRNEGKQTMNDPIEEAIDHVLLEAVKSEILRKLMKATSVSVRPGFANHEGPVKKEPSLLHRLYRGPAGRRASEQLFNPLLWSEITDEDFLVLKPEEALKDKYKKGFIFWYCEKGKEFEKESGGYRHSWKHKITVPPNTLAGVTMQGKPVEVGYPEIGVAHGEKIKTMAQYSDVAYVLPLALVRKWEFPFGARPAVSGGTKTSYEKRARRDLARSGATALLSPADVKATNQGRYQSMIKDRTTPEGVKLLVQKILHLSSRRYLACLDQMDASTAEAELQALRREGEGMIELQKDAWKTYVEIVQKNIRDEVLKKEDPEEWKRRKARAKEDPGYFSFTSWTEELVKLKDFLRKARDPEYKSSW